MFTKLSIDRVDALLLTVYNILISGISQTPETVIHRLAKVDTKGGISTVRKTATQGVPYPTLLYERFLGRPFASHRDAVSEIVGNIVESEIENQLVRHKVTFYKPPIGQPILGLDQAPDFLIPSAESPKAVIEAKLTEDDGTARDKVSRVQHLRASADQNSGFDVIACIDGRGFSIRREDMRKLLLATKGKVFTLRTINQLIPSTVLRHFQSPR